MPPTEHRNRYLRTALSSLQLFPLSDQLNDDVGRSAIGIRDEDLEEYDNREERTVTKITQRHEIQSESVQPVGLAMPLATCQPR